MVAELQPVCACDLDATVLEGADHRLEEDVAPPHQDHHVAGSDSARLAARGVDDPLARGRVEPHGDLTGEPLGEDHRGIVGGGLVERHAPVVGVARLLGLDRRPDLDDPCQTPADRLVGRRRLALRGDAAPGGFGLEDLVHSGEDGGRRAERIVERRRSRTASPPRDAAARMRAASRRTAPAPRPGRKRSTASRRRRRTRCDDAAARPTPAKNSSVSASTIRHCSAELSWASSIKRWSSP